jgi:hypothetical protein
MEKAASAAFFYSPALRRAIGDTNGVVQVPPTKKVASLLGVVGVGSVAGGGVVDVVWLAGAWPSGTVPGCAGAGWA